jgi:hypothetical protein
MGRALGIAAAGLGDLSLSGLMDAASLFTINCTVNLHSHRLSRQLCMERPVRIHLPRTIFWSCALLLMVRPRLEEFWNFNFDLPHWQDASEENPRDSKGASRSASFAGC